MKVLFRGDSERENERKLTNDSFGSTNFRVELFFPLPFLIVYGIVKKRGTRRGREKKK